MNKTQTKPHIAYVMGFMGISGGNRIIYEHANRLADRGFEVTLLHLNDGKDRDWFQINPKVEILPFRDTAKWIKNIDIIIATFNETLWDIIDLPNNIKKAYLVQSDERIFYDKGSLGKYLSNATYSFKNVHYLTTAKWMQDWLKKEYGTDSTVLQNKIEEKDFYPEPDPKLKSNKVIVLVEGNVSTPLKGVKDAAMTLEDIDCEKWLLTNTPTNQFPEYTKVFDKIFSNPPQNEIRKIYSSADILLKTSYFESVSLPNMEAMCCKCAVISTSTYGATEYSTHLENSYLVEVGNISQIKEALTILINDKVLRDKLKQNGYEYARKSFYGWDKEIDKLEEFFMQIHSKETEEQNSIRSRSTRLMLEKEYCSLKQRLYRKTRQIFKTAK